LEAYCSIAISAVAFDISAVSTIIRGPVNKKSDRASASGAAIVVPAGRVLLDILYQLNEVAAAFYDLPSG